MSRKSVYLFLILFIFSALISLTATAEPWLSNRFSQNCAGCHAPGRYNLPAKKRRCTLSCQGCHVNPNGGGMRSDYGKWTQQRWLKTFHVKKYKFNKNAPAPDFAQGYMQKSKTLKYKQKKKSKKIRSRKSKKANQKNRSKKIKNVKKANIPKMYTTTAVDHKEEYYDMFSNDDWKINAKSMKQFLTHVPIGDPWRTEREDMISGGGDFRYFYGSLTRSIKTPNSPDPEEITSDLNLLMGADLGLRLKPVRENLSFVFEGRFFGNPSVKNNTGVLEPLNNSAKLRSAYVFSDNLIYNTWFMAGKYRPNFGNYTADHDSLMAKMSGMNQFSVYNSVGFGGSPNVPFFDMHYIFKKEGPKFSGDRMNNGSSQVDLTEEQGFNVNLGARAVTLGLSGKASYWATSLDDGTTRTLMSVSGGAKWKRLVGNFDILRWSVANPSETAGNVTTVDLKYRAWRENYLVVNYSSSNTATNAKPGRATEYSLGLKSYLLSGVKLELIYKNRTSETTDPNLADTTTNSYFVQLHTFY